MEVPTLTDFKRLEEKMDKLLTFHGEQPNKTIWTLPEIMRHMNLPHYNAWYRARRKLIALGMTMQGRNYYITQSILMKYYNQNSNQK